MVISPPYDVITPAERARLAGHHSANAVRVELPEPDHREGLDRYANAARLLCQWLESGILFRDQGPAFYAYRMVSPDGSSTSGVIGALGVDDRSAATIQPHEETLPKPKSDRLDLLRSTRANLSPIWGLSLTPGLTATVARLEPPDESAVDEDGIRHELWVLDDPDMIDTIAAQVGESPIVLADGHHRYETARTYLHELQAADGTPAAADLVGADAVMALVVELAADQLEVGPVHRTLSGLPEGLDLADCFSSWFDLTRAGEFDERTVAALGETGALALVMPSGAWLLSPKDGTPEAAGADLDSSMVALVIAELPEHELEFFTDWQQGVAAIVDDRAQALVLLRPVAVGTIAEWARSGRRMPPKSTYFHPKPRTGMVYRMLDPATSI
jgi:uncharacterized protein (DUF1015 family)